MKPYKNLKTVFISNDAVTTSFIKAIHVPFNVDEITVRSYTMIVRDATNENINMSMLSSNLVNGPLVTIPPYAAGETGVHFINTLFKSQGIPINSEYSFNWTNIDLSTVDYPDTFSISISIQMLFIEY